jgi:hypothetical protein
MRMRCESSVAAESGRPPSTLQSSTYRGGCSTDTAARSLGDARAGKGVEYFELKGRALAYGNASTVLLSASQHSVAFPRQHTFQYSELVSCREFARLFVRTSASHQQNMYTMYKGNSTACIAWVAGDCIKKAINERPEIILCSRYHPASQHGQRSSRPLNSPKRR